MNLILREDKLKTKLPVVLRTALKLFIRKGIDGTTIKDIAKEAKVAEGALYRHYKGKDELAWDLFSSHLARFTEELRAAVMTLPTARERVYRFVQESFAAYESDPDLYTYLILQEHSELDKFANNFEHPGHIVTQIIEEGQKDGSIRNGDPYVLGSLFIGSIIRVAVVKMYGSIAADLRTQADFVAEGIWSMLRQA